MRDAYINIESLFLYANAKQMVHLNEWINPQLNKPH